MSVRRTFKVITINALVVAMLSACSDENVASHPQAAAAPEVSVAQVVTERITEWDEFTGRLQAPQTVELVPRISGYVEQVMFEEGAVVKAGDLLFSIDNRPFIAEVARLKAELQSAESAAELAVSEYDRAKRLSTQRAISIEVLDNRKARMQQTAASVASVKAALARAELDLAYTRVTAPIDGRVSYAKVTAGNYVTAGQTQLTSLVSTDRMYAYFDVDEQTYLKYIRLIQSGKLADTRAANTNPVYLALAGDNDFNQIGTIDFVDNRVDPTSGTMRLRASFPNKDQLLLPGLFAKLRLAGSATYDGVLIDEKSIGTDLANKFVLLVNDKNQLEYRAIELGEKLNGLRLVNKGLTSSDRIVVNGLQRVRPSMQITPKMVDMATASQLNALKEAQQLLDQATSSLAVRSDIADNRS